MLATAHQIIPRRDGYCSPEWPLVRLRSPNIVRSSQPRSSDPDFTIVLVESSPTSLAT
jgi:hypothetical protein